jgi:hypothetical protein
MAYKTRKKTSSAQIVVFLDDAISEDISTCQRSLFLDAYRSGDYEFVLEAI